MEGRLNINVSAISYDETSKALSRRLALLEEMAHMEKGERFAMTDSEFAFGWHFFVLSVDRSMIDGLAAMMGPDFERLKGKGSDKKFLTWLAKNAGADSPRFKMQIKEEMESSKFGIF